VKICFAIPDALYGGIHTLALNLGRQFTRDGHRVSAVISARGVTGRCLGDVDEMKQVMEVHVCAQQRVLVRSHFLQRVIDSIEAVKPDIMILNHTLWAQAALPYLDPAMRRVIVVHGLTGMEFDLPKANSGYWDAIVAVGPSLERRLLELWDRAKVRLIPVGVPEPPMSRVMDFREPVLKVCYVGRVDRAQKNVLLIPAIARALVGRGVRFAWKIVGDGPDLNALVAKVSEVGLTELFEFAGGCDQARVQEILMRQHVLVLPSNWESIGHVLLEAQMLGVVPVASRLLGATDFVITHGWDGLLCEPGDSGGFADALVSLSADRGGLERLSLAAQVGVRERFEISRIAAHYYDLFGSLSRTNSQARRARSILGYYPIPRSLLPSRVRTAMRLGRGLVLDRMRKTEAGNASINN
jgi:glycosyltransferase involved in cell wall biosynthesis